jgi:uncharacterized protein (DUF58 family)
MATRLTLPSFSPAKDPGAFPGFKGEISRWTWKFITQRLTYAGRWFAIGSLLVLGYSGASLQIQAYALAAYLVALWCTAWAAVFFYRPRVTPNFKMPGRVTVDEVLPIDVELEQVGRGRGADLVVVPNQLPAQIDSVPEEGVAVPDLKRGQHMRVRLGLKCKRRGKYLLKGVRVETGFPFGILRSRRTFYDVRSILVYPKFTTLAQLKLPTGRRYQPGGVALASEIGESFEYLGNREYREGDNVRDIDWRATARVQRPIVREWVEEYMLRVAVILDTHVPGNAKQDRRDAFERAVSVSAAVSDYMARQDYLVDLFAAGPNLYHLTAGRSLAYLDQILDILACVDENPAEPFDVIEPQIAELLARISTVICVFLDWNDARRAFVHRISSQGVAVKVIILRDGLCSLDPAIDSDVLGEAPVISKADYDRGIDQL